MSGFVITKTQKILQVDPDEVLDYIIDFNDWMPAGDSIQSVVIAANTSTVNFYDVTTNDAPMDVAGYGQVPVNTVVIFWSKEGAVNTTGELTLRVTTVGGRKKDITYTIVVKHD